MTGTLQPRHYTSREFGAWVGQRIRELRVIQRAIAEEARVDPAYLTHIKRGFVPKKDVVRRLAVALQVDTDEMLIRAGYAPESLTTRELLTLLEEPKSAPTSPVHRLLMSLPARDRTRAALFLRNCIATVKGRAL